MPAWEAGPWDPLEPLDPWGPWAWPEQIGAGAWHLKSWEDVGSVADFFAVFFCGVNFLRMISGLRRRTLDLSAQINQLSYNPWKKGIWPPKLGCHHRTIK